MEISMEIINMGCTNYQAKLGHEHEQGPIFVVQRGLYIIILIRKLKLYKDFISFRLQKIELKFHGLPKIEGLEGCPKTIHG